MLNHIHKVQIKDCKRSGRLWIKSPQNFVQCPLFALVYILFLVFLFFQISIFGKLHLAYFILIVFFPITLYFRRATCRLNIFNLFFLILAGTSLAAYFKYGFGFESIRVVVMIISFYFGCWSIKSVAAQYDNIIKMSTIVFFVLYYFRNVIFYNDLIRLFSEGRESSVVSTFHCIANGGLNIECTILAFIAMLQTKRSYFYFSFVNAFLMSMIFGSRVGLILCLMALAFWAINGKKINSKSIAKIASVFLVVLSIAILASMFFPKQNAFSRFSQRAIDAEVKYGDLGIGRLGFYFGSIILLKENIFGYGATNSVRIMTDMTGVKHIENNIHNIYLQILLDGGLQSLIMLIIIFLFITKRLIKNKFLFPPLRVAFSYLVIGFLQFTGYDLLGWFFIGTSYGYLQSQGLTLTPTRCSQNSQGQICSSYETAETANETL